MNVTHLKCSVCGMRHDAARLQNLCTTCSKPLLAEYDLERAARTMTRESLACRRADLWRYLEVLPLCADGDIVTLGEGFTPLLPAGRLGGQLGLRSLFIKDESQNPTQSFKARGMSVAVSMAKKLGATKLAVPSAGNAGGALAAYAASAALEAHIFMPRDTPRANVLECEHTGAHVTLIDGLISDCAAEIARRTDAEGWFDVSTLREPYRLEGKKTLGYELFEQMKGSLPDVIVYPTGGGTGLIGMWKAFDEMQQLGWIGSLRPRIIAVQASGCAPIVRAFEAGKRHADPIDDARTFAAGLRVPRAIGDFLILDAIRESGGCAVAVSDEQIRHAIRRTGALEGLFMAPEGAACVAALEQLVRDGRINPDETVVSFNTAAGSKYLDLR
ncbi:MAG: threonine synthase [Tepidisphaeraceae bacterium]